MENKKILECPKWLSIDTISFAQIYAYATSKDFETIPSKNSDPVAKILSD